MKKENTNINEALLMSYFLKEANPEQTKIVENWLKISTNNLKEFNELKIVWYETGKLSPIPVAVNTNSAWNKINSKINFDEEKTFTITPPKKNLFGIFLKIAAIFVLIFGGISIFLILNKPEIQYTTLKSSEIKITDTLKDGSIINLNKKSQLTYSEDFNTKNRKVELKGEAFFDVKPNSEKPFVIKTKNGNIKVLGTSFNVNSKSENNTEVFVKTGLVKLFKVNEKNDTFSIVLSAGEKGIFNRKTGKPEILKTKKLNANDMYWINNTIIFDDVKLYEVAETLENIFKISIKFKENEIKNLTYTSTFYNDSIKQIIDVIAVTFNLEVSEKNNIFTISKNKN